MGEIVPVFRDRMMHVYACFSVEWNFDGTRQFTGSYLAGRHLNRVAARLLVR